MTVLIEDHEFLNMIQLNKKLIFKVCSFYCRGSEDRKDLVQEVIIRLWQAYAKYDSRFKVSTWMYRIALNTAISYYRSNKRRKNSTVLTGESLLDVPYEEYDPETDDRISELYLLIGHLNELNRALMLLYLDRNSYKEIAEVLGISETNVATKISRLKIDLKKQFNGNGTR